MEVPQNRVEPMSSYADRLKALREQLKRDVSTVSWCR